MNTFIPKDRGRELDFSRNMHIKLNLDMQQRRWPMTRRFLAIFVSGLFILGVVGENSAQVYQTYNNALGSTTYGPRGQVYHTYNNAMGSTTFGPEGQIYQTLRNPRGSTTFGPEGQVYQTLRSPRGSTTYEPGGRVYQTYSNPGGSTTYGPR